MFGSESTHSPALQIHKHIHGSIEYPESMAPLPLPYSCLDLEPSYLLRGSATCWLVQLDACWQTDVLTPSSHRCPTLWVPTEHLLLPTGPRASCLLVSPDWSFPPTYMHASQVWGRNRHSCQQLQPCSSCWCWAPPISPCSRRSPQQLCTLVPS